MTAGERVKCMLVCGLLQVAAYYGMATWANSGPHVAVPQPDTLLYCQSARQIADGAPFVYSPGDKPSTGSTSHLYPFVLAALYKAGAAGDALLTAGFALNALFYLIFLANWGWAVERLGSRPLDKNVACLLMALNGQAAYCALAQSDTGIFMAFSSGLFLAALAGRFGVLAGLLVITPWVRPEGFVLAVLLVVALGVRRALLRQSVSRLEWGGALAGTLSALGVFAFNRWLTGYAQYESLLFKGYFKQYELISAVDRSLTDAVRMGREILLGLPESCPREIFFLPLIGALLAWAGLFWRPWRRAQSWKEVWWLSACVVGFGGVASSGWQDTNIDRYLAWILPIWLFYMAEGAVGVVRRLPRKGGVRLLPVLAVGAFQAVGALCLATFYYTSCLVSQQSYEDVKAAHALLPKEARVGGTNCAHAYALPGRRFVHLVGIYSPDMLAAMPVTNFERMKARPELRFDYWILSGKGASFRGADFSALCGERSAVGIDGLHLAPARWDALERSRLPAQAKQETWALVDTLDVGCPEAESRCGYETFSRFQGAQLDPCGFSWGAETNAVFDAGRVVLGSDSMTVRVRPGVPLKVVMRTAAKADTQLTRGYQKRVQTFTFSSPLKMRVHVDGADAGVFDLPLVPDEARFSEVSFTLPAEAVRNPETRLTLFGDHVALTYWFYQPE